MSAELGAAEASSVPISSCPLQQTPRYTSTPGTGYAPKGYLKSPGPRRGYRVVDWFDTGVPAWLFDWESGVTPLLGGDGSPDEGVEEVVEVVADLKGGEEGMTVEAVADG